MNVSNAIAVIRVFSIILFLVILYLLGESGKQYRTVVFISIASIATIEVFGLRKLKNTSTDVVAEVKEKHNSNNHLVFLIIGGMALVALTFYALEEKLQPRENYASCMDDASKKPTEVGVRLSAKECQRVFVDEPKIAAREKVETSRMAVWAERHTYTLAELDAKIGERLSESGEFPCSADKKKACTMVDWPFDEGRSLRAEVWNGQISSSFPKPVFRK